MRILHISTRLILGGSQENTVLSCEGQARRGHDVHLAFGPIYGPEGSLLERVQKFRTDDGRGITTHVVPHLVREVRPLADRHATRELGDLIGTLRPDIVHTHSSKAGVLGRAAAWAHRHHHQGGRSWANINGQAGRDIVNLGAMREAGEDPNEGGLCDTWWETGIVHTIHGPPFMPVDGGLAQRVRRMIMNWVYTRAERYAAKRCHVIVSVADAMTREFLARGIGRREQYVTVRSGMEVEPFLHASPGETREAMRAAIGFGPDDFVVGTVARLAEHKGHDDLLDALGETMRRTPRLKLLWVGDGWWRERLVAKAISLGLAIVELDKHSSRSYALGAPAPPPAVSHRNPQIVLTGLVPPARIPGLIRAMDALAHPSYREGLPRTVPQALLCGVCPVAYDCDGTGEVCREMETGRLVPVGDREKLRDAIVWLMEHPAERAAMAARGREECRVAFSAEHMVDELEKVYQRAIELARGETTSAPVPI